MHETRLALTIAGGVSLGAYEAGVLDELTWTLDKLNEKENSPDLPEEERRRYVIDIFTGGSAGSITGALVAFAMLHDWPGSRSMAREAWVERVDIRKLLGDGKGLSPAGILDKRFLYELRDGLLLRRMSAPGDTVPVTEKASFCPGDDRPVHFHFSLSNLNGIDYARAYANQEGALVTTYFKDRYARTLRPGSPRTWGDWRDLATAALASGTFPFAFPPELLDRTQDDYPGGMLGALRMSFVDGGIFDNEPLRAAFHAAGRHDRDEHADRLHLLIDPFVNTSARRDGFGPDQELVAIAGRLAAAIRGQASAKDFLKAERRNSELEWTDRVAIAAQSALGHLGDEHAAEVEAELDELLASMAKTKRVIDGDPTLSPDRLVTEAWPASRPLAPDASTVVRKFVAALGVAAGQQNKRTTDVYLIGARTEDLAGEGLGAFGGFFDERLRRHDYHVGRAYAREQLPAILNYPPGTIPHEPGVPPDMPDELRPLTDYSLDQLKRDHPREYREIWKRAATATVRGLKLHPILRPFVRPWIQGKIRKLVESMDE